MEHWRQSRRSGGIAALVLALCVTGTAVAQDFTTYHGDMVPSSVEAMYIKGLNYLVKNQQANGAWANADPGVVGLAVLSMLAHGDDPEQGPYHDAIHKGLDFILKAQVSSSGYIGPSMYNHGFATLALAEAYGAVNDPRIGPALKKAVDLIITSQSANGFGAWRYSPESRDADTTVSGAQMVALFAARNAGITVPDKAIAAGLKYYRQMQSGDGGFGYTNAGDSSAPRTAIGALVFALGRQKAGTEFKSAMRNLDQGAAHQDGGHAHYFLYYAAQSYFHADPELWRTWNKANIEAVAQTQQGDGSWNGQNGPAFCTATALLSLALNYRFLPIYER